jgi:hypothetical protein
VDGWVDDESGSIVAGAGHAGAGEGVGVGGLGLAGDGFGKISCEADVFPRGGIGLADDQPNLKFLRGVGKDTLVLGTHSGTHIWLPLKSFGAERADSTTERADSLPT